MAYGTEQVQPMPSASWSISVASWHNTRTNASGVVAQSRSARRFLPRWLRPIPSSLESRRDRHLRQVRQPSDRAARPTCGGREVAVPPTLAPARRAIDPVSCAAGPPGRLSGTAAHSMAVPGYWGRPGIARAERCGRSSHNSPVGEPKGDMSSNQATRRPSSVLYHQPNGWGRLLSAFV